VKIAHVVTYISADGAFGGPVAVAASQAEQLAREGHEVEIIAGWDGVAAFEVPGVKITLHKVRRVAPGFSGLVAPRLQRQLRTERYDCVHVHLARDLITTPAALNLTRSGRAFVLQPHGMVMPDRRPQSRIFDWYATRKILQRANAIFTLTAVESVGVIAVSGSEKVRPIQIANGIRSSDNSTSPIRDVDYPEVIFLARLHPRKQVMAFAKMAALLISRGSNATFHVVGPDEGDLPELKRYISVRGLSGKIQYEGAIPAGAGAARIARGSVFVLPSTGEVFPMTVLEAMSVGTPVVISEDCGISPELRRRHAALVVDPSPEALADAVELLLTDTASRDVVLRNAEIAVADWLNVEAISAILVRGYQAA